MCHIQFLVAVNFSQQAPYRAVEGRDASISLTAHGANFQNAFDVFVVAKDGTAKSECFWYV